MDQKEFQTFADNWRERYVTAEEAAKFLGVSPRSLANDRWRNIGCPYHKFQSRVYYDVNDLKKYLKSSFVRIETTSK